MRAEQPLPKIKGFVENTLLDWEGRVVSVLFLPRCNFRCGYCHAGYLVSAPNEMESIPLEGVLSALQRGRGWVDGVVLSGGEPTLHPGLERLIRLLRSEGFPVKLDTNGSRPDVLEALMSEKLLDYVAMDIKAPLDERYSAVAGVSCDLEALERSVELLIAGDVDYEFRTTVCPFYLDRDGVEGVARAVRGAGRLVLQRFRPTQCLIPDLEEVEPYNDDEMRAMAELSSRYVRECYVRGDQSSRVTTR